MRFIQSLTGSLEKVVFLWWTTLSNFNRIRKFKMELPDALLAFKLLDTAGLNVKDKQLVLTASPSISFVDIKSALKRIFGYNVTLPQEGGSALQMSKY